MPKPSITKRELAQVRTVKASGPDEVVQRVCCTRLQQSVSMAQCLGCSRMAEVQLMDGVITALFCDVGTDQACDAPVRMVKLPMTSVAAVMSRGFTCVRADLTLDAATALFLESDSQVFPVVDGQGTLLGFVCEQDIQLDVHARSGESDLDSRTVFDVMLPFPLVVPEHTPISQAAGALAYEQQRHAAVVASDGRVIGVLSYEDVLRWLARADGYLL